MIKNIIFDLGNVLLNYQPQDYLKSKNIDSEKITDVHDSIFKSEEWLMLDRGVISEKEAKDILMKRNPVNSEHIQLAFDNWYEMLTPIEESVAMLKSLKAAGYQLYFLSNFHLLSFEEVTNKYDFFNCFDGGVVSYQENLIKPEPAIYETILNRYHLNPKESLFIDDMLENIEAAQALHFKTIHLKCPTTLKEQLQLHQIQA